MNLNFPERFEPDFSKAEEMMANIVTHEELNDRLLARLDAVEKAIETAAIKNWVERNPELWAFWTIVLSAFVSAVISIIVSRVL